jgi:hypothetical protein
MDAKLMKDVEKIVLAGLKIFYDDASAEMRKTIVSKNGPAVELLASNVVGLIYAMWGKSGSKLPPKAIIPAATILLFEMAAFMTDAGREVPEDDVKEAIPLLIDMIRDMFKKVMANKGSGQPAAPEQQDPQQQQQQQQPQPQQPAQQPQQPMQPETGGGMISTGA